MGSEGGSCGGGGWGGEGEVCFSSFAVGEHGAFGEVCGGGDKSFWVRSVFLFKCFFMAFTNFWAFDKIASASGLSMAAVMLYS